MEEKLPVVDEMGNVVGTASRKDCHSGLKILHPVVHLHVFDKSGRLFLQLRSPKKSYSRINGIHQLADTLTLEKLSSRL